MAAPRSELLNEQNFEKQIPVAIEPKDTSLHGLTQNQAPRQGVMVPIVDEVKVLRKMDIRIIPILAVLFLLSYLDRSNIGNAKIQGMTEDLKITSEQFNLCLTVFYFTYAAVEIPSNILLKKLKPSVWFASIMIAWGSVTTLIGVVQNYHGLLIARIFLGITEGGMYPGIVYYVTQFYSRRDAQFRQALCFSSVALAGAFSGLLAYAIGKMDGVGGLAGWRWIFILEGILTVVVACCAYFWIIDSPEAAGFLTKEEREWVISRTVFKPINAEGQAIEQDDEFQWKYVKDALTDWQVLTAMFMNMGLLVPLYGISVFLPTIIRDLGYRSTTAQLMTVPVYGLSTVLSLGAAWIVDRKEQRSPFLIGLILCTMAGYVITIAGAAKGIAGVTYAGVFVVVSGIYTAFPGNIAWISNNVAGNYKRACAMAIHVGFGNMGGAMSSNFYRARDSPKFLLGHALSFGFLGVAMMAVLALRLGYQRVNKQRETQTLDGYSDLELSRMGDKAPNFKYSL
ncbi:uncharacterized protein A1O9_05163 [Exophiala aquamarina CBS 119918]|uniref:Major facilitator superfamily (MFS) profile domain-containing protein n=1 Tax=Exophiala aquamarina CBS 119918 TaxID=1182545 RepID=A0A072PBM2_9EURO|nr:uncharacterized protein A1O9_05163 [Exophiala aquamarina CBS 119918]KEF57246.1 hypothetical protein A1O9_05163 [Exophiala aquamarina CBS 119918]